MPKSRKGFLLLLVLVLVAACEADNAREYPPETREEYLAGCTQRGALPEFCECTLQKLEQRLTHREYQKLDQAVRTGSDKARERLQQTLIAVKQECRRR